MLYRSTGPKYRKLKFLLQGTRGLVGRHYRLGLKSEINASLQTSTYVCMCPRTEVDQVPCPSYDTLAPPWWERSASQPTRIVHVCQRTTKHRRACARRKVVSMKHNNKQILTGPIGASPYTGPPYSIMCVRARQCVSCCALKSSRCHIRNTFGGQDPRPNLFCQQFRSRRWRYDLHLLCIVVCYNALPLMEGTYTASNN